MPWKLENAEIGLTEVDHTTVGIRNPSGGWAIIHKGLKAFFTFAECHLSLFAIGHILEDYNGGNNSSLTIQNRS